MQKEEVKKDAAYYLSLINSVGEEWYIKRVFTNTRGMCCAVGHVVRLESENPEDYSELNCSDHMNGNTDFRDYTEKFLKEVHDMHVSVVAVNNDESYIPDKYKKEGVKERVVALLEDMIEHGY